MIKGRDNHNYYTAADINSKKDVIKFWREHNNMESFLCDGECKEEIDECCNHFNECWEKIVEIVPEKEFKRMLALGMLDDRAPHSKGDYDSMMCEYNIAQERLRLKDTSHG